MSELRGFTGVFIPAELYLDPSMSWIEKILLVEVVALDAYSGHCFASNAHFAAHLQVSEARASEIIAKLVDKGYLEAGQDRISEGSRLRRFITVTDKARTLFAPRSGTKAPDASGNRRSVHNSEVELRKTEGNLRKTEAHIDDIITSSNNIPLTPNAEPTAREETGYVRPVQVSRPVNTRREPDVTAGLPGWQGDPAVRARALAVEGEPWVRSYLDPAEVLADGRIVARTGIALTKLSGSLALKGLAVISASEALRVQALAKVPATAASGGP